MSEQAETAEPTVPPDDECRNCRRLIHWVPGIGWLHGEIPKYAHESNDCVYAHPVSCTLHRRGECPKGYDLV